MKVVLDEGVPRQLVEALRERGIDASRFLPGWTGASNGALLAALEEHGFDILLTNDRNIANQQSLRRRKVAVVALPHNRRTRTVIRIEGDRMVREELPTVPPFRFR